MMHPQHVYLICNNGYMCIPTPTRYDTNSTSMPSFENNVDLGSPGVFFWIREEWLFIFRELGSTGNYFQGFEKQANSFGDLGCPEKKTKKKSYHKGFRLIS